MTTERYMEMAKAIAARDHSLNMIGKWQQKVEAAEADIQRLASELAQEQAAPQLAPEQV